MHISASHFYCKVSAAFPPHATQLGKAQKVH